MASEADKPGRSRRLYPWLKRTLDLAIAVPAVIILAPVMLAIAVAIRLDSPGPAIFRQKRAGRGGRPFVLLKFRTMHAGVDPFGRSPQSRDDPRLTRVGRWLRETSLDELPQLFNVIRGEMSLVGPRPLYLQQAERWNARQRRRLEVKPGLTGLAQVAARADLPHELKLELDVRYVERASFWLDLKLLAQTMWVAVRRRGIYERQAYLDERSAWDASRLRPPSGGNETTSDHDGHAADAGKPTTETNVPRKGDGK